MCSRGSSATYSDLTVLSSGEAASHLLTLLAQAAIKVTAVCLTTYAAGLLTLLGTAAALQLAFAVRLPYPTLCASLRGHLAPTAAGIALLPRRAAEAALAVCKVPPADYRMGTRALDPSSRA